MANVLAFAMQKGGVGKTTTTLNLGVNLAKNGAKVLLIDLDPQANLTQGLGIEVPDADPTVYEVLLNPKEGVRFATIATDVGVDLVPSTLALAGAELELAGKIGREILLREALSRAEDEYNYILVDSPPNLGLFTLNALAAASSVVVPIQPHVYAWNGVPQLEATIELVRKLNPTLAISGIVLTLYNRTANLSKVIEQQIRAQYGYLVFETVIPMNTKVAESPASGKPVMLYDPQSQGAQAYAKLAKEVEVRYGK